MSDEQNITDEMGINTTEMITIIAKAMRSYIKNPYLVTWTAENWIRSCAGWHLENRQEQTREIEKLKTTEKLFEQTLTRMEKERDELKQQLANTKDSFDSMHRQLVESWKSDATETCAVCKWTNIGCLNLGNPNEIPIWMCHGCIKREHDNFVNKLVTVNEEVQSLKLELDSLYREL